MHKINMDKVKRERSVNFSLEERDILVTLVLKYKDILENKQSDASTWKTKECTWDNIEKEFNARSGAAQRNSKALRIKYEGLKRSVRKKSAAIHSELYRTGGGSNTAIPLDTTEEKIKSLITLSTDGLESMFDSDVLPQTQHSQDDLGNAFMEQFIVIASNTESDLNENKSIFNEDSQVEEVDMELLSSCKETVEVVDDPLIDDVNVIKEDTSPRKKTKLTPSSSLKWDVTSRRHLKTKRHPALVANFQKKSLDELTQAKLELVQLQKELLGTERVEKRKESEFKEKQRQWMEEEHLLKLTEMVEKRKESEFKEKQRQWMEEEHLLKLTEMVEKRKESEFKEKQRQWMEEEHLLKLKILQNELNK